MSIGLLLVIGCIGLQRLTPIRGRKPKLSQSLSYSAVSFTKITPDKGISLLVTLKIGYKKSNHLILQTVAFLFCCFIKFT